MATITQTIANWAAAVRYEALRPEVVAAAKRFLYDSVGCALGALHMPESRVWLDHAAALGGREECTLIGSGAKTNAVQAAMVNAFLLRAMDYNDIYWKQDPSHPSDIIPAALALAERDHLGGRDLIVGIVVAYEVETRLCEFALPGIRERGWHHATLTALAAPVAAGRMLNLTPEQIVHAIGIGGCHGATYGCAVAGALTAMKNTVDPMAVRDGVEAALLAERGYTGPAHVVDGKEGMMHCLGPAWNADALTKGLDRCDKILDCGMKAFPTEALTHSPITATLTLMREHALKAEEIEEVHIESIARAADILSDPSKYDPQTKETADHSLPYCIAAALADGQVTPAQFTHEKLHDPRLRRQLPKVVVVANEEFERAFPAQQCSRVAFRTTDGRELSCQVDVPKGDPRNPMTDEDLDAKFAALATPVMTPSRQAALRKAIFSLESLEDVADLMQLSVSDIPHETR